MKNILIKNWRLIAIILGIILFIWVLYLLKTFILPFAVGLVLAYLFMPLVSWLSRKLPPRDKWPGVKRVFSVIIAFILLICIVGGFAYIVVTAVGCANTQICGQGEPAHAAVAPKRWPARGRGLALPWNSYSGNYKMAALPAAN